MGSDSAPRGSITEVRVLTPLAVPPEGWPDRTHFPSRGEDSGLSGIMCSSSSHISEHAGGVAFIVPGSS